MFGFSYNSSSCWCCEQMFCDFEWDTSFTKGKEKHKLKHQKVPHPYPCYTNEFMSAHEHLSSFPWESNRNQNIPVLKLNLLPSKLLCLCQNLSVFLTCIVEKKACLWMRSPFGDKNVLRPWISIWESKWQTLFCGYWNSHPFFSCLELKLKWRNYATFPSLNIYTRKAPNIL